MDAAQRTARVTINRHDNAHFAARLDVLGVGEQVAYDRNGAIAWHKLALGQVERSSTHSPGRLRCRYHGQPRR